MDDRISIIVSTYKRKEKLGRLLESFSRLSCRCPFEIIIVDSASGDGTEEIVNAWMPGITFADVKYHVLKERAPLAHTRNVGISLSTGNIIAFTDDDCAVDPAWLDQLYARLISCPEYAGAGGRVLAMGDDLYSRYSTIFRVLEPPEQPNTIVGANCMFWKQPVIDAGLFDECFVALGGEETALCMKLWLGGYRFGFEEKAIVYHDYRNSFRDFYRTFYQYGTGDRVLFSHSLNGYLRYIHYPEKFYNTLAFRNHPRFLVRFTRDLLFGIACQYRVLYRKTSSCTEALLLNGLFAVHLFSYHRGRGTFSGALPRAVKEYLAGNPDHLLSVEPGTGPVPPLLEITGDTIPPVLRPGKTVQVSITIKNPDPDHFIPAGFHIVLENAADRTVFYRTPEPETMLFFPGTDLGCTFPLLSPADEQRAVLQVFLVTRDGAVISNKREIRLSISSEEPDPESSAAVPACQ